ncbi:hypothetical protein [Cupriavidus consociatus]|nr:MULTISPECIES: hypothetical protein [unclassified Cupriavidus]MBP0625441.1 hypothetical protein [Cupriavidus sp. LEh25]MDK2662185.1 hypothetical protein [Cupriavidus sp. LEh21]
MLIARETRQDRHAIHTDLYDGEELPGSPLSNPTNDLSMLAACPSHSAI